MREAISELNAEYQGRIDEIAAENPHDELSLAGSKVPWREVLAVWSVMTAADPAEPADVLTLDERRLSSLEKVFWDMNAIGFEVQERRVEEIVEVGIVSKFSGCWTGVEWFRAAGLWRERGYEPEPGAIVFFDWDGDAASDHVGVVESCDGSTVRTIEGNTSDSCAKRSYAVGNPSILGYGVPLY